ncbi:thermonuclease family protein [Pseudovibrio sp. Ad37]|uniref:thermonuclease family protein n=1 Tax=Pseudovibrio sp. Ad37 TaxID=989422 RepID=UPI0007AE5C60|nr:thermonuclease family protein [Pseudovibrio sp. Ad37]KZL24250.1 Endonuclease YncB precursor [Pseudovibrio sp. Ad37]
MKRNNVLVLSVFFVGLNACIAAEALAEESSREISRARVEYQKCDKGRGPDCVIDGDTFYIGYERIRISDINTPETYRPECDYEAQLGAKATARMIELLNAGPFELVATGRDKDRYGRLLRKVVRDGRSLGDILVREGLARHWTGRRKPWC